MQFFSRPDRYFSKCGSLNAAITQNDIPGAPAFMKGLRALFVSDLHVSKAAKDSDILRLIEIFGKLSPDILLLGGDYSDDAENSLRFIKAMKGFHAPLGLFAVPGNNDRESWPEIEEMRNHMEASGIRLLVNESAEVALPGGNLIIAGVDEHKYGQPDTSGLYPTETNAYRILLSHYPCTPAVLPDLMLSGHTHGGQFNCLGVTPYTIGFERIIHRHRAPEIIAGLKPSGEGLILVSKGIGASRIPLRIGVKPEINLLNFNC